MGILRRWFARNTPSDRRAHHRVSGPQLKLRIDGRRYQSVDWSLGGFRISSFPRGAARGERISGSIGFGGFNQGEFVGRIVNVGDDGAIGVRLLEISPSVFVAMAGLKGM